MFITMKPGSNETISFEPSDPYGESGQGFGGTIIADGNDRFTFTGSEFDMDWLREESIKEDLKTGCAMVSTEETLYIIAYEGTLDNIPAGFTDVPSNSPFKDAIDWAVKKKITVGTSKTTFSPGSSCTHNHILTFLWRANGSPSTTGKNDFEKAVSWAKSKGLISGSYNGDKACTRAEAMTYLWKLAGSPKVSTGNYQPQTITGIYDGKSCSITFSAATKQKTTVTKRSYENYDELFSDAVTLITIQPGSSITVKGTPFILTRPYEVLSDGTYEDPGPQGAFELTTCEVGQHVGNSNFAAEETMNFTDSDGNPYLLVVSPSASSSSFSDVPASASYAQAVAWAVAQGITSGTSKTTFSPNTACTRGQIVTFLYRAMGK